MPSGWKKIILGLSMLSLFSLTACATSGGIPSNYDQRAARAAELQSVLLLTPDITVNSLSAGDVKEEMPEWSEQARQIVIEAVPEDLALKQDLFGKIAATCGATGATRSTPFPCRTATTSST